MVEAEVDEGNLEIEATTASLVVTATYECGNEATCTVELCVPVGDDSDDSDSEND